jgi:type II secretory pathway pseudopilin PulG
MSDTFLTPAPGAKAAKVCGILAIVFALTCIGFPVAIILGIVALVQQAKAKRLAKAQPETYEPVSSTGLVTGIIGLVLPVVMLPFAGIVSAIAIPAFLAQRDRAQEIAVQSNLSAAKAQAEATLQSMHAKNPSQMPSQDAIIQALATNPLIQSLKNPVSSSSPAFQRGTSGPLGTVMVFPDREEEGGITTWTLQFQAVIKRGGQEKTLKDELITHTQEQVQSRTEDGWEVVHPAPENPATPTVPAPQN